MDQYSASENISFGGQPTLEDLKALAAKGVKTIINTRLPSEDQGELFPERAKAEVEALGMTYLNIPVSSSEFSDESLAEVSRAISEAAAEGDRVRAMHKPITMRSAEGKQISALNPASYQWVIATGYIVTAQGGRLLIGREFTAGEKVELLRDNRRLARLLHVPMRDYPQTPEEMDAYFESWIDRLQATPQALQLIEEMKTGKVDLPPSVPAPLRPLARRLARPGLRLNYLSVVGLLDPRLRDKLGVTWSPAEERELQRIYAVIRTAYRVLPDRLTYFPLAYHARKHHQCLQKMKQRQQKSFAYNLPR